MLIRKKPKRRPKAPDGYVSERLTIDVEVCFFSGESTVIPGCFTVNDIKLGIMGRRWMADMSKNCLHDVMIFSYDDMVVLENNSCAPAQCRAVIPNEPEEERRKGMAQTSRNLSVST